MATEKVVKEIDIKSKGAEDALKNISKSSKNASEATDILEKSVSNLPGPLGKAKEGVQAVSKAFKALLANPIVLLIAAIVAAIAGMVKAFTKTQEGADKLKDVMAGLSAVMDVIIDRAAKLFKGLIQILKGNVKEGMDQIKGSVEGVADEMKEAVKAAIELEAAQRRLYEAETGLITVNAKRMQQIAELRYASQDLTKSVNERRDAIIEADKIETEILADNIKLQEMRIANLQKEIDSTPELMVQRELQRQMAEEEAKLTNLATESTMKRLEFLGQLNTLEAEIEGNRKARSDAELKRLADEAAAAKELRMQKIAEDVADAELLANLENDLLKEQQANDAAYLKEFEDNKKASNDAAFKSTKERFDKEQKLLEQQLLNERLLADVKAGIYENSLTALLGFLGEGSKVGKGIMIADATRTAIMTAMEAYKSAAAIPVVGPVLGPVAGVAALAAGMANVKKIAQVETPGVSGGGTAPSITMATPDAAINIDDITNGAIGIGQDVNIIQDQTARSSMKAYVVESEVTAQQDISRQRQAETSL